MNVWAKRVSRGFNSRAREGATHSFQQLMFYCIRFNSRAREGATKLKGYWQGNPPCFNSRAREGATNWMFNIYLIRPSFNSRAREGATEESILVTPGYLVSTHAPVRARLPFQRC